MFHPSKHPKRDWKLVVETCSTLLHLRKHPKRDWKNQTPTPQEWEKVMKHPKRDWKVVVFHPIGREHYHEASQKGLKDFSHSLSTRSLNLWSIPKGIERFLHNHFLFKQMMKHPKRDWKKLYIVMLFSSYFMEASQKGLKEATAAYPSAPTIMWSIPKGIERIC